MSVSSHAPVVLEPATTERRSTTIVRWLGALALLSVGIDHIYEYYANDYRAIRTIGTLFLLNFVSALVVALGLVAPLRRFAGRFNGRLVSLLALSGIGIGVGTLAGLLYSENSVLFGFREFGYRSEIVLSIVLDVAAVVLLAAFLFLSTRPDGGRTAHVPLRAARS
jgi:hypothetical protein